MRKLTLLVGIALSSLLVFAAPALADTSIPVIMTFTEPAVAAVQGDCPATNGFCGVGDVRPFGFATEMIEFGAGCGGACDLRTIKLDGGTIVIEETFSEPDWICPGNCSQQRGSGLPGTGPLSDVIVGGTGAFEGASGTLSGTVHLAGHSTQIQLSGTLILS